MKIVGIDPGLGGAIALIAVVDGSSHYFDCADMPTMQRGDSETRRELNAATLAAMLREWKPDFAIIERTSAMPKQGVASVYNFGETAGQIKGVIVTLGIPIKLVVPRVWKKLAGLIGQDKEASRAAAIRLFPTAPLDKKKHEARAEALLIAHHGRKLL